MKNCKSEINKIINYRIEGMKVRSRELTLPNEEKGSRDFYNIDTMKKKQENIDCIVNEQNIEISEGSVIKQEIFKFYKDLYTSNGTSNTAIDKLVNEYRPVENLNEGDIDMLNKPYTLNEIESAINKMKNNKSPGPDGLPKEYYSVMFDEIKYDLLSFIQGMDLHDTLPKSITTGTIKLLHKKGDKRLLKNWRPISLLNVDLKIVTSLIATRLSKIMHKLINPNQTCAIKGRFMFENTLAIEQLLQLFEFYKDKYCDITYFTILSLDMEKAFDS